MGIGRIGTILGNIIFGHLLDENTILLPILIVACLLILGAMAVIFLPPINSPENSPPLLKAVSRWRSRLLS